MLKLPFPPVFGIGSWSVPAVRHGYSKPCLCRSPKCQVVSYCCLLALSGIYVMSDALLKDTFLTCQYPCPALPYSRGIIGHICLVIECCETGNRAPRSQAQCRGRTPLTGFACVCEMMENIGSFICFKVNKSFCKKQAYL